MTPEQVARLLPQILESACSRGTPLAALVELMASLHGSVEEATARLPSVLAPWRTPSRFVALLADWLGLPREAGVDEAHTRALIERAASFFRRRGTERALLQMLELATGLSGFALHAGDEPFALTLQTPSGASRQRERVAEIVACMKPAAVRLRVLYADGEE